MVEIDGKLEISDIQLPEEDNETEIIFEEEEEIESCLDSESDVLDSIPKLVFIDEGSIKMLETTSSSTPVIVRLKLPINTSVVSVKRKDIKESQLS